MPVTILRPTPRFGSFLACLDAGHSRRDLGLFHGAAKGVK